MLALLGLPFTDVRHGHGTPGKHEHALLTADATTEHWVLEDGSKEARYCSAGRRGAAEEECLAAVREAASRDGLEVTGFKSVNDGPEGLVPAGCSYSLHTMKAMFNTNAAGRYIASKAPASTRPEPTNYRLACLALPDKAPSAESTRSEARTPSPPEKRSTVLFWHVHNHDEVSNSQHQQIVDSCRSARAASGVRRPTRPARRIFQPKPCSTPFDPRRNSSKCHGQVTEAKSNHCAHWPAQLSRTHGAPPCCGAHRWASVRRRTVP